MESCKCTQEEAGSEPPVSKSSIFSQSSQPNRHADPVSHSSILTEKRCAYSHCSDDATKDEDDNLRQASVSDGHGGDRAELPLPSIQWSPRPFPALSGTGDGESQALDGTRKTQPQRVERGSPEGKKFLKYQSPGKADMRHQLLIQRTFSPHDEKFEPRTSSPLRKVRVCTDRLGCSPVRGTPASVCNSPKESAHSSNMLVPFLYPPVENSASHQDMQTIFKTPIRAQHGSTENSCHMSTPSRPALSLFSSPASSGSCLFTPGRNFVNPFEMDHERLHMPIYSPSIFKVGSSSSSQRTDTEGFWSVEHAALIKPVDIQDSAVHRQLRYQQKIDREHDDKVQRAINTFFSSELIVPSPWSEKVKHVLPRTPGSIKSVSCQTTLSVPPGVDLFAELAGKYELPESKTDSSPLVDSLGSSFIRRKLLNQLNENDSEILASPALSLGLPEKPSSTSPSPGKRQSTPEWEQQTPNKHGTGHFSSSPIPEEPDERGHHPALSESDLLASPELSPIAGIRSTRSSAIYYSEQELENPRAIMQLDFSSILEDNSSDEEEEGGDRLGTMIRQTATGNQHMRESASDLGLHTSAEPHLQASTMSSQDGETVQATEQFSQRPLLQSGLSCESTSDTVSCSTSGPQLGSSQDTGYHTSSLQSTTTLTHSSSNLPQMDSAGGSSCPTVDQADAELAGGARCKPNTSNNGSFCASSCEGALRGAGLSTNDSFIIRGREPCLVRKIRALSDVRLSREKRNVSRDLTQSFNMDCSSKSDGLSDNENLVGSSGSRVRLMDGGESLDISMHSSYSSDFVSSHTKILPPPRVPTHTTDFGSDDVGKEFQEIMEPVGKQFQEIIEPVGKEFQEIMEPELPDYQFQSKFAVSDDDALEQARRLLGKSEELRQRHSQHEPFIADAFHRVLMGSDENFDPASLLTASPAASESAPCDSGSGCCTSVSPQTPRVLERIERNINSVHSSRLGSEIAAEILKRAGDDLAKVSDILEDNSPTPS